MEADRTEVPQTENKKQPKPERQKTEIKQMPETGSKQGGTPELKVHLFKRRLSHLQNDGIDIDYQGTLT